MEPLGTITSYFPFIDEETRNVLENIMNEASDYYDFAEKLGDLVVNNESPIMVVYFAIQHGALAFNLKLIDKIREKYGHHPILGPNLFLTSSTYQGSIEDLRKIHELTDAVLMTEPDDWISLEMYLIKFEADMRNYPKTVCPPSMVDKIRQLIDSNSRFGFYELTLLDNSEIRARADGDSEERMRCINKGLRIAKKFDDKVRMAHLLTRKADILMNSDRVECRALLEQVYQLVESSLGIPLNYGDIITLMGVLEALRGEFDSAIKRFLKVVAIRERAGLNTGIASYYLSTLYNLIGEPESGLEWGCMSEDQQRRRPNRSILNQVWSLILLKRFTDAQNLLDMTQESIQKSGDESQLAWLHFVTGLLEMEQGEPSLALSSIEQALRIYERHGLGLIIELVFLVQLAKIEVYYSDPENSATPYLAILLDKASSEDLPGFLGQALLLKADIASMNKDESNLREILPQLRKLCENENMQFLKPSFERLLERL